MKLKTRWAEYDGCYLVVDKYVADKSPAIQIWNMADGPIAKLTVCLDFPGQLGDNESFVDTNNLPEAMDFIREYGLGEETGLGARSGRCIYPLVRWNMDAVEKYKSAS